MKLRSLTAVEDESGLKGTSPVWRISIVATLISLAIYAVGFATPRWVGFDKENFDPAIDDARYLPSQLRSDIQTQATHSGVLIELHYGLWQKCAAVWTNDTKTYDDCVDLENEKTWITVSKVLCCVGVALATIGLLAAFLAGGIGSNGLQGVAAMLVILSGISGAIGSAIFVGEAKDDDDRLDPHYSVFLSLIGCAFLILGGGLQLLSIQSGYSTIA